jgi:glycogen debranching enzyme
MASTTKNSHRVTVEINLRRQYGEHGIYAGATHFRDYWARDSLFACLGALALGTPQDVAQVRKTLTYFLNNLREDGHVPLRIGATSEVARYLGLPTRTRVVHAQDKGRNDSYDGNALLLIVAAEYERVSRTKLPRVQLARVMAWLNAHDTNGLLVQGPYSDWEDSISVPGARLYTNVCYYRALRAAAVIFRDAAYAKRAAKTKKRIQSWWNKTHFTDGVQRDKRIVMTAGNLLAIVWGVASKGQSTTILARLAQRTTVCPPAGLFRPTLREVYPPFFLLGLHDYHASMEWSWLASLELWAYRTSGKKTDFLRRKKILDALVEEHGGLFEVYDNNKPVKRWFYRSEKSFAWALGVYCAATRN